MAFRRPIFVALCFDSAGSNCGVLRGEQCLQHSHTSPTSTYCYRTTSYFNGVALRTCGKLDGHIDGMQHMLGTMYRWCVAAFSSGLWNIPTPVDQVLDGRVIQTHVKIDAFCEQRWPTKQYLGKKSGHMLHLLCHQGPLGTVCLQQDSDQVWLWPGYHLHHDIDTVNHGYSGVVKESTRVVWCSVVFGDESRFCLYASDGHTCVRCRPGKHHLPECIHP